MQRPKGDSVYFTVPAAFSWQIGEVADHLPGSSNTRREGMKMQKARRERGCGVGERLRDYWTPVYFVDIAARWYLFLLCLVALSFSPRTLPVPVAPLPAPEAIKALSTVTV